LGADTAAARPIAIANFLLQSGSFKKKKLKMVADHQICISVLEGAFVSLSEVGLHAFARQRSTT